MELISKQAVINKILNQSEELHPPSWYAIQIKALDSININEKIDQAYEDGYETGYLQAKFDYEQEKEELREPGEQMHSPRSCRMIPAAAQPTRCKDCKHFIDNGEGNRLCTNPYTWVTSTDYDFGCIYAER